MNTEDTADAEGKAGSLREDGKGREWMGCAVWAFAGFVLKRVDVDDCWKRTVPKFSRKETATLT